MKQDSLQSIEYQVALLVRLTTAHSPKLGSLDRSEYLILYELQKSGALGINELAEQLMVSISTASRQVSNLEAKAYITRHADPKNRRISLLQITEEGKAALRKVQEARATGYDEILKEWSKEELEQLEVNLERLNQSFKSWKK
ncbi:HTH-type transcriptional regulator MhqR [Oceanobacillus picturae]|uniref:HTH-type transcriptional regulator MhqR n=1 Tax=Oceanobacillus picturae TaxID=171693 RepID=W9B7X5_9BACI|nr:MarR family transcriptional regulator [Oceanobacillus picturae]GAQ19652.1 HTH-type transcriptional regulator MhqR [Oceanobacillus picturae]CDO02695.1 HTH-type transcriptional regulator MhqR [Oceanobacillus picturae]